GDEDGRVEAEGVVRCGQVVVDRLRDADDREAVLLVEAGCNPERVFATDRDESVQSLLGEGREHAFDAALRLVGVRPRGAENRAASGQDPRDLAVTERLKQAVEQASPALAHSDDLCVFVEQAARDCTDDGVQPGAVAATCEDPDLAVHAATLFMRAEVAELADAPDSKSGGA